ncbi:hypothetical protein IWZ01DRAFT_8746 [Phyllosticta capitalensis]
MPCDRDSGHVHQWPTQGELTIYHCERECGFCNVTTKQCSHLRAHVKERHLKQYPLLKLLPGKMGNAGKYPTDRHLPKKKALRAKNAAAPTSSASGESICPEQLPLPDSPVYGTEQSLQSQTRNVGPTTTDVHLQEVSHSPGWDGHQQEMPAMNPADMVSTFWVQDLPQTPFADCVGRASEQCDDADDMSSTFDSHVYDQYTEQFDNAYKYQDSAPGDGSAFFNTFADSFGHFAHSPTMETRGINIDYRIPSPQHQVVSYGHRPCSGPTTTTGCAGLWFPGHKPTLPLRPRTCPTEILTPLVGEPTPLLLPETSHDELTFPAPQDQPVPTEDPAHEGPTQNNVNSMSPNFDDICPEVTAQEEVDAMMAQIPSIFSKALAKGVNINNLQSYINKKVQQMHDDATIGLAGDQPDP